MQVRRAGARIEFLRIEFDVVEVMGKRRFANKVINRGQRPLRRAHQCLVLHQQEMLRLFAVKGAFDQVVRPSDQPLGRGQSIGAGIDRAVGLEVEN